MSEAIAVKEHKDITTREAETPTETQTFMAMIERAASNPELDVEKFRALLDMKKEVMHDEAKRQFDVAMNECQHEMTPISQDASNPQTRSKYASYKALDQALRPIYTKYGFSVDFDTADGAPENCVRVVCDVSRAGHTKRKQLDIAADGKGAKGGDVMTKTHAILSAVSYGRRALLKMAFNIAEGEHDDDGNAAGAGDKITAKQCDELIALADEIGADKAKFCEWAGVESFADISAAKFDQAKAALEQKRKAK